MRIVCKKHGTQDVVFYALNGRINKKCSVCQIEYEIKKYKGIKNEKYNARSGNNGNLEQFSDPDNWSRRI